MGSGLEGVDLDAAGVRGISVANVPASGQQRVHLWRVELRA